MKGQGEKRNRSYISKLKVKKSIFYLKFVLYLLYYISRGIGMGTVEEVVSTHRKERVRKRQRDMSNSDSNLVIVEGLCEHPS